MGTYKQLTQGARYQIYALTPGLAPGMNACLAEGVIRRSGASPLSTPGH